MVSPVERQSKLTQSPKSTASPCLVRIRKIESAGSSRNYWKKAMKEEPRRVLSCRSCLNPSFRANLDKVLLTASFKAEAFSGFEQALCAYPDGAQLSSIIRCRAFTNTASEG